MAFFLWSYLILLVNLQKIFDLALYANDSVNY